MNSFQLGGRPIGPDCPCFVVAEVAQAHDGSLGAAHAFIDVAAKAGADAIKFQTHIAAAESTAREQFRVTFSRQDATRYDYWKRMEFTEAQWIGLKAHADEVGLIFLSSAFSVQAVELLQRIGMPAWKVGSGEVSNDVLLRAMIATGKPVLLSSGMSSYAELDAAVSLVRQAGNRVMIFQCTTKYPCLPKDAGLNCIQEMCSRYGVPVGFSDHSGQPYLGIAAAALGAKAIEVHVAMSKDSFGPDVSASLTPEQLGCMVEGLRAVEASLMNPVSKDALAASLRDVKALFSRSVVAAMDLACGTILAEEHLAYKKPSGGLLPREAGRVIGRKLTRDLVRDELIGVCDVE